MSSTTKEPNSGRLIDSTQKAKSWQMFDRIAKTYDPLNRILSMGIDESWRRKVAKRLPNKEDLEILDLATGTGDLLFAMVKKHPSVKRATGMDLSEGMLDIAREKLDKRKLDEPITFAAGDATKLPVEDASYDVVSNSFGIRNVANLDDALSEMYRVLKPGGRALILEFGLPKNAALRWGYLLYFRNILPMLGGMISGDKDAYRYLNQTVEQFPYGDTFVKRMEEVGFQQVSATPLQFGIAFLYQGEKV